jgi:hypothetical protein
MTEIGRGDRIASAVEIFRCPTPSPGHRCAQCRQLFAATLRRGSSISVAIILAMRIKVEDRRDDQQVRCREHRRHGLPARVVARFVRSAGVEPSLVDPLIVNLRSVARPGNRRGNAVSQVMPVASAPISRDALADR